MMKNKILAVAISMALFGCVATTEEQTAEGVLDASPVSINEKAAKVQKVNTEAPAAVEKVVVAKSAKTTSGDTVITLEKIMSDPDWISRAPESWYWGDDSQTIFYKQKREGNPVRDLYHVSITSPNSAKQVDLAKQHQLADRGAVLNNDGSKEAYIFQGNVFVKNLDTGAVRSLLKHRRTKVL